MNEFHETDRDRMLRIECMLITMNSAIKQVKHDVDIIFNRLVLRPV